MHWSIYVLIALILLPSLFNGIMFAYHHAKTPKEKAEIKPQGLLVKIKGLNMNVFCANDTESISLPTIILLSGSGVTAPIFDYKNLYSQLKTVSKVFVLEKFGYGYADESGNSKDIKTLVDDDREALRKANVMPPYILMPHSMSALEAIYWTHNYPLEVKAIIGLDMAVPERYHNYQNRLKKIRFFHFMMTFGWQRIPTIFPIFKTGLTHEEIRQNQILSYKNALNNDVFQECMHVCENAAIVESIGTPDVPILMFTTTLKRSIGYEAWMDAQTRFAQKNKKCQQIILDCSHNLHHEKAEEIAMEIQKFIVMLSAHPHKHN
ncbi:MAG: hypothetical protein PHT27_02410 [Candidatus Izemoplasmatales bacterium]|nr:hypothetical protein [Candidatus Izemoplasmatales bacterium]